MTRKLAQALFLLILLTGLASSLWLIGQRQEIREKAAIINPADTHYRIPILVLNYFPTKDGVNLDEGITGIGSTVNGIKEKTVRLTKEAELALERASVYRGYKKREAPASLDYEIIETLEFKEQIPVSGNEIPWKRGQGVYRPDYMKILRDVNICDWVEKRGVKQVWLWGYHHGNIEPAESNMAGPHGDISNSERIDDMPVCKKTYVLFNYNYSRELGEMMENHGHQIEAVLRFIDNDLFWNKFVGPYGDQPGNRRCGWTHYAPNGSGDYDWQSERGVLSDCEDWRPEGGELKELTCHNWHGGECKDDGGVAFKTWWMQNIPGRANTLNYNGKKLRNWWDFIGDFDIALASGKSLVFEGESSGSSTVSPGDLDRDGDVDIFDYNLMVSHFGSRMPVDGTPADIDNDGDVDIFDYNILLTNFGR